MTKDYDKKLFRLIKILNLIQDSKKTNTAALAAEFNISRRTAQRDVGRLITAGFPIIEDDLQKGAYRFFPGYSLKGLPVSDQEVSLLVSLCDVARNLGGNFSQAYKNIFAKVMNSGDWDSPFFVMMPKAAKSTGNEAIIKTAEAAISAYKRVRINYENASGEKKEAVMEPLKLIFYEGFWYLLVRSPGQDWVIKNRVDRIHKLEVLEERFKPAKGLEKMLQETQSIWFGERRDKVVRIRVAAEVAAYFSARNNLPLQKTVKRGKDGSLVIETKLCHFMEVLPLIYRWIPFLTVISPKELRVTVRKTVSAYLRGL